MEIFTTSVKFSTMFRTKQLKGFIATICGSFRRILRGRHAIASYEDIRVRRESCQACEFLIGSTRKTLRCESCGCQISLKIMFSTAECPEGKWEAVDY